MAHSEIKELQTPTKLYKKESARLDKILDSQGVLKDFTVISTLYMNILILVEVGFDFFSNVSLTLKRFHVGVDVSNESSLCLIDYIVH
jgi:hypothetical protein